MPPLASAHMKCTRHPSLLQIAQLLAGQRAAGKVHRATTPLLGSNPSATTHQLCDLKGPLTP